MPSKGITVYSYVSLTGYEVEFVVPKKSVRNTAADNFTSKDLEVESSNIEGVGKYTGRFEWKAFDSDGNVVGSRFNNINSLTGNLEGGSMTSTVSPSFHGNVSCSSLIGEGIGRVRPHRHGQRDHNIWLLRRWPRRSGSPQP